MWEMLIRSLDQQDPLEEAMATHSSILAWRVPWTEEPGALQSIGSHRVGHDLRDLALMHTIFKGYFPFIVITKYWLHSPCCTVHPWAYATPSSLCLPLPHPCIISPPSSLVTTNLHSVSLLLFYYIHYVLYFLDSAHKCKISYSICLYLT